MKITIDIDYEVDGEEIDPEITFQSIISNIEMPTIIEVSPETLIVIMSYKYNQIK